MRRFLKSDKKIDGVIAFIREFSRKVSDSHTAACAAQAAFFILLSVVPILSLILAVGTYLPFTQQDVQDVLMGFIPNEFKQYVADVIGDLYSRAGTAVISISAITLLWSASKGVAALRDGFDSMYSVEHESGFLKSRMVAVLYTIVFVILFALVMSAYVTVSHYYKSYIGNLFEMGSFASHAFLFIRYVMGWLLFYVFILMMYVVLPKGFVWPIGKEKRLAFVTLIRERMYGAVFCSVAWMVISKVLVLYIQYFPNLSVMYGSLAGIVIVMLWLYFCMYSLFIGAVINYFIKRRLDTPKKDVTIDVLLNH